MIFIILTLKKIYIVKKTKKLTKNSKGKAKLKKGKKARFILSFIRNLLTWLFVKKKHILVFQLFAT